MTSQRLRKILEGNGIFYENNNLVNAESIDSITFVSAIVDIEEEYHVFIPNEYVSIQLITNLEELSYLIDELSKKSELESGSIG